MYYNRGGDGMKLIKRVKYLNEIAELIGIPDIKVITGIRRCGKSKIMDALTELIKESDPSGNVIHVNYNITEFENLLEYHALEDYIESQYITEGGMTGSYLYKNSNQKYRYINDEVLNALVVRDIIKEVLYSK